MSELRRLASDNISTIDADQRGLGRAVQGVHDALSDLVKRTNPAVADELSNIDRAYAMQLRLENAAGRAGTAGRSGVFTPAQLDAAVRDLDSSLRGRAYARGDALLQDFAEAGVKALGQKVPDSGTPFRMLMNANPLYWPIAWAGSQPWSPAASKAINTLLASRPPGAEELGGLLRQGGTALAGGASRLPFVSGLLGGP
jgi:hypothetical protein